MSEHREWEYNSVGASVDRAKEHNATVRAYRDAMAECERLGRANNEACDRIAELEAEVRIVTEHADTWSAKVRELEKWKTETLDENNRLDRELDEARQAIKALESRPVLTWEECEAKLHDLNPSVSTFGEFERDIMIFLDWLKSRLPAPTDSIRVPFSDAQIEAMAKAAHKDFKNPDWEVSQFKDQWRSAIRAALSAVPCAVPERASDEELAEIACSVYHTGKMGAKRDMSIAGTHWPRTIAAVRARVEAPLLAEIERLEIECQDRAFYVTEFAAVSRERDTLKARVAELESVGTEYLLQSERMITTLRAELESVTAERDGQLSAAIKMSGELQNAQMCRDEAMKALDAKLAALRQPVDPDAWKTPLPAPETRKVKVWLPDVEDVNGHLIKHNFSTTTHIEMGEALRFAAENAVIDVPQGVPSVEALTEIGLSAEVKAAAGGRSHRACSEAFATAVRDTVLASLPATTPHAATDAEVEALARVLHQAFCVKRYPFESSTFQSDWCDCARAAFAHIGKPTRSNAEMQVCINRKNRRIDALKACVKKWKAKATTPIASAETLEQLVEILRRAMTGGECAGKPSAAYRNGVTAILRAAKARVDVEPGQSYQHGVMTYSFEKHSNYLDWLNSRIVYGVQLPEPAATLLHSGPTRAEAEAKWVEINKASTGDLLGDIWKYLEWLKTQLPTERAEVPSSGEIEDIIERHVGWLREDPDDSGHEAIKVVGFADAAEEILTALRPWLRTPTGWELDLVVGEEYSDGGGGTFKFYEQHPIEAIKSRIRPTFECQECAVWKTTYERDKAGWQERAGRARAALEVE